MSVMNKHVSETLSVSMGDCCLYAWSVPPFLYCLFDRWGIADGPISKTIHLVTAPRT